MISRSFERPERTAKHVNDTSNPYRMQHIGPQDASASCLVSAHDHILGTHTHVATTYKRLGLELPEGTIDKEIVAYAQPPAATDDEIADGYSRVGMVGELLSLRELHFAFTELEADLDELAGRYRT